MTYAEQFGPDHVSWLIEHSRLPVITTLGPIAFAEPHELTSDLRQDLVQWGVIDGNDTLTEQAWDLFEPLFHYSYSYWGVLLLHNEKEPIRIDMDKDLIDMGLGLSLTDTPRVFWNITKQGNTLTMAMRAGDVIVVQKSTGTGNIERNIAAMLMSILDPNDQWPSANFPALVIPLQPLATLEVSRGLSDKDIAHKARTRLAQAGVPPQDISLFSRLLDIEALASTEVVFSPSPTQVSSKSFIIKFLHRLGVVVQGEKFTIDGDEAVLYAPGTLENIADQLVRVRNADMRRLVTCD